nr:questin oxidase family protein [Tissierella sp.]
MTVEEIINETGAEYSPYMGDLVNHLPMAQWAVYKLSQDRDTVDKFTKKYLSRSSVNKVKKDYKKVESIESALGNRELYEGTLDFLKKQALTLDIEIITRDIINKYPLGMSSGLFHTLIRVAYGVEGYKEKPELKDELLRGLAYYITAYREAKEFKREIDPDEFRQEIEKLSRDVHIREILENNNTLGQTIRELYDDEDYIKKGFTIKGGEDIKIKTLLKFLIPLFYEKGNIVILHCITSIHALLMLKDYYNDFENMIDILTSCIITHLISTGIKDYPEMKELNTGLSWKCIVEKTIKSNDVHDVKLTYSAFSLDGIYNIEQLKDVSIKRIRRS